MASFNQVCLVGNVTREIEMKYLQSGTPVCDIGLAVNEKRKSGDEWVDEVSYFDCAAFGRTAEVAGEHLSKGSQVLVSGKLKQERWEKDGQKFNKVKVIVDRLVMLGGKRDEHSQERPESRQEYSQAPQRDHKAERVAEAQGPPPSDDIPF